MAHVTFPKPVKAAKKPNRTVSRARAAKRRQSEAVKTSVYQLVDERDGYHCRVCYLFPVDVHHHIVFRSQGGKHTTANVCTVCVACHKAIHDRRIYVEGNANLTLLIRPGIPQESPCPSSS